MDSKKISLLLAICWSFIAFSQEGIMTTHEIEQKVNKESGERGSLPEKQPVLLPEEQRQPETSLKSKEIGPEKEPGKAIPVIVHIESEEDQAKVTLEEEKEASLAAKKKEQPITKEIVKLWNDAAAKSQLPGVRFTEVEIQAPLKNKIAALKTPTFTSRDLGEPKTAELLLKNQQELRQIDTALQIMLSETLIFLKNIKAPDPTKNIKAPSPEEIATTALTLARLSSIRSEIATEQKNSSRYLTTIQAVKSNRLRYLINEIGVSESMFTDPTQVTTKNLEDITTRLKKFTINLAGLDTDKIDQMIKETDTGKLQVANPEHVALKNFLENNVANIKEAINTIEESDQNKKVLQELKDQIATLEKQGIITTDLMLTAWQQIQNKTFVTKFREFFKVLKQCMEAVGYKASAIGNLILGTAGPLAPSTENWQAVSEIITPEINAEEWPKVVQDLKDRLDELNVFIGSTTNFITELGKSDIQNMSFNKQQVLVQLRSGLIDYLGAVSSLGEIAGLHIKNSAHFGSHILDFISAWYRPTGEDITKDQIQQLTASGIEVGNEMAFITALSKQSERAAQHLDTLDSQIFKNSSTALAGLYHFSFISSVLAHTTAAVAWGVTQPLVNLLNQIGVILNINISQALLPIPFLLVVAASMLEALSYGIRKGAISLATRSNS